MPRTPKGHKRPADVIGNAVQVMKIATGEIDDVAEGTSVEPQKDPAAVSLGRKGGTARAEKLSKVRLTAIARKAARSRWQQKG